MKFSLSSCYAVSFLFGVHEVGVEILARLIKDKTLYRSQTTRLLSCHVVPDLTLGDLQEVFLNGFMSVVE